MRNERETVFCRLVPMRGKGMQFGTRRAPNPACARTHQSRRHTSKRICDNVNNCQPFAHISNKVNIDKIPPTATLSNPAYVNAYPAGFPSSVMFPPVTRFNDFALTISDNQAVQSVSATIQYWDGSSETITPLTLNNDQTTSAFTPGRPSFNVLITLKKSGTAIITVTIRDTAGNEIRPVYTIDTEFRPMLHLDTAGFVDFRTQSLVVTPQDFAKTTPASADARYKKVGSTYNLIGTGAAITPNFHYILRNSAGTVVRDSNAPLNNAYMFVSGEGVLTLTNSAITNLSTLADGEYKLSAIYSDNFVPENPDYASVAILLIDNTTAPSATNPASPQRLTFSPAVPAPRVVAATGHVSTRDCDSTGVAVSPKTIKEPLTQQNKSITFLKCQADVQATGFSAVGKRDIYILSAKQQASATEKSLPTALQAMVMVAVAPEGRGADNMTADGRIIRADVQAGTTDAEKVQAVATQVSTVAPNQVMDIQSKTVAQQVPETVMNTTMHNIVAPSDTQFPDTLITATVDLVKNINLSVSNIGSIYASTEIGDRVSGTIQWKAYEQNLDSTVIHAKPTATGHVTASPTTPYQNVGTTGNSSPSSSGTGVTNTPIDCSKLSPTSSEYKIKHCDF